MKNIVIQVEDNINEFLEERSKQQGLSVNELLSNIIKEYVNSPAKIVLNNAEDVLVEFLKNKEDVPFTYIRPIESVMERRVKENIK